MVLALDWVPCPWLPRKLTCEVGMRTGEQGQGADDVAIVSHDVAVVSHIIMHMEEHKQTRQESLRPLLHCQTFNNER
jgi:hypothetical protein